MKNKLFLILSVACSLAGSYASAKNIALTNELLRAADSAGFFNGPILDILRTREAIIDLVVGKKMWSGAIVDFTAGKDATLTAYCRRPEALFGATFVVITADHPKVKTLTTAENKDAVETYLAKNSHRPFYDRQFHVSEEAIFTGSYATNPVNGEKLPIYISDYAIETFDTRRTATHVGIPAHNSKDFAFAQQNNIDVKVVITAPDDMIGVDNDNGPMLEAPQTDAQGNLTQPYIGEYRECVLQNSDFADNLEIQDGAKRIIEFLEENNAGVAHTEALQYKYDDQYHSIKNLAKVEAFMNSKKHDLPKETVHDKVKELQIILNYAQADFLEIVEPFFVNAKNTKDLMVDLIEESCKLRNNNDCYLLRWCHIKGDEDERVIFHRDITSVRYLTIFCKDLVNFLGDLAHSCPRALEDLRKRTS